MRSYTPEIIAMLNSGKVKICGMVRLDFPEGSFGFINRTASKVFGGLTYEPIPQQMFKASNFVAGTGTSAARFNLTFGASPDFEFTPDVINQIEAYEYIGAEVTLYDFIHDPVTNAEISDPIAMASGVIDAAEYVGDQSEALNLSIADTGLNMSKRNDRHRTPQDLQRRSATDEFYKHLTTAGTENITWGE